MAQAPAAEQEGLTPRVRPGSRRKFSNKFLEINLR